MKKMSKPLALLLAGMSVCLSGMRKGADKASGSGGWTSGQVQEV